MIEESTESPLEQHRVHLLHRPYQASAPPRLRIKVALSSANRGWMYSLSFLLAAVLLAGTVLLWRTATAQSWGVNPPWHILINVIFTVMLCGLAVVAVSLAIAAGRSSGNRARALHTWEDLLPQVRAHPATVISRRAGDSEGGGLVRIELTAQTAEGDRVRGVWAPIRGASGNVLQSQVPPIGAAAVVWRVPGADASAPLVIEVFDPTAIPTGGPAGDRTYLG